MAREIPTLSFGDSLRFKLWLLLPNVLQGLFTRKPLWVGLFTRLDADRRGYELLERLHRRHGTGALLLRGGKDAVLLDPGTIRQVLEASPDPWGPPKPKRKGMGHFQPEAVTLSTGDDWRRRRDFNERVLESGQALHGLAAPFLEVVKDEVDAASGDGERWHWARFERLFERISVQVIFGREARHEVELTRALVELMHKANRLVVLRRSKDFAILHDGIEGHLRSPHAGSLMEVAAHSRPDAAIRAGRQVPHWMFAMGGTLAVNAVRALAAIAAQPSVEQRVRRELEAAELDDARSVGGLRYLAGCLQEAMRLWPTTPLLAREAQSAVELDGVRIPAGGKALIPNVYNHRAEAVERAHELVPERWQGEIEAYRFNHLSNGPQVCAGADLAIYLGVAALAHLLAHGRWQLESPLLPRSGPLPFMFDHFKLRLRRAP